MRQESRSFAWVRWMGRLKPAHTESHTFASRPAKVEGGTYPYWQTEYAYTYGEPPAGSIAAAFPRYLTDQGGKDILREYGNRPCSETEYPLVCEPT